MELKDIKELIALIRKNDLSEFSLEQEGFKITLKRGYDLPPIVSAPHPQLAPPALAHFSGHPQTATSGSPAQLPASSTQDGARDLPSPMVGTFYSSPSPDAPAFVTVGQQVTPETVICIIEAMKVMNEIKAEVSGTVVEVVAENGKPVQYGQPLFRIR